ncbi:MAG: hypothetical protein U9R79_07410, partial [Armatimonadota bacterium]|nr:hypothetical protein [Armatimonadota bacterium]
YQFAMNNWQRSGYHVRYFHSAADGDADAEANALLRAASREGGGNANVIFEDVEVAADGSVPAEHDAAWRGRSAGDLPLHVVTSPRGRTVVARRLTPDEAESLVRSPARRTLGERLCGGDAGVLLVLQDPAAGDASNALRTARRVAVTAPAEGLEVGVVAVVRDDAAERMLVRQLLQVEGDLSEIEGSMVFGIIGRGYALPPYIGAGVSEEGLADLVAFMHAPCACEIKASNPGTDLLTSHNWAATLPQWASGVPLESSFLLFDEVEENGAASATGTDRAAAADRAREDAATGLALAAGPAAESKVTTPSTTRPEPAASVHVQAGADEPSEPAVPEQAETPGDDAMTAPPRSEEETAGAAPVARDTDPKTVTEAKGPDEAPMGRLRQSRAPDLPRGEVPQSLARESSEASLASLLGPRVAAVVLLLAAAAVGIGAIVMRRRAGGGVV